MRDANRIDLILRELKSIWERYPDLRLGQIVINAVERGQGEHFTPDDTTAMKLFYIEDEPLLEMIKNAFPK